MCYSLNPWQILDVTGRCFGWKRTVPTADKKTSEASTFSQRPLRWREDWKDLGDKFNGLFECCPGSDYLNIMDMNMDLQRQAAAAMGRDAIVADFEDGFRKGEEQFYEWLATQDDMMKMIWNLAFEGRTPPHAQRMLALLHRYTQ